MYAEGTYFLSRGKRVARSVERERERGEEMETGCGEDQKGESVNHSRRVYLQSKLSIKFDIKLKNNICLEMATVHKNNMIRFFQFLDFYGTDAFTTHPRSALPSLSLSTQHSTFHAHATPTNVVIHRVTRLGEFSPIRRLFRLGTGLKTA
jgi:hypothetical protein